MQAIAFLLLLLGTVLAGFGSLVYVVNAMSDPDIETLRIARAAALTGRAPCAAGLAAWFGTGQSAPPPIALLLITTALAATATVLTRLAPPPRGATT
jgi:hypothetical protein